MRLPYPERIPYSGATIFATVLLVIQLVERTQFYFALCCFACILVFTAAFNIAGGLYRPAGAYIFFNAVLTLVVGLMTKAAVGERADSNIPEPLLTVQIYLVGAITMLVAAYIESRFRKPTSALSKYFPMDNLRGVYIGCVIVGVGARLLYLFGPGGGAPGSFLSAFRSADRFIPLAIVLGVLYTVRSTNGRRSITTGLGLLLAATTFVGVLSFSKEAMFQAAFCYVLGIGIARFNLKPINYAGMAVAFFLLIHYGTPLSQIGRDYGSDEGIVGNGPIVWYFVSNMDELMKLYKETNEFVDPEAYRLAYFNQAEGLLDRLQMISPDAGLTYITVRDGPMGYEPLEDYFKNLVPHFIWPDKPDVYFGNVYAHQLGLLDPEDISTSVSFSTSADFYHQGGWTGVIVAETLCITLMFLVFSRVLGDVRDNPVCVVAIVLCGHFAPEGGSGCVIQFVQISLVILALGFVCHHILPVIASVFEPKGQIAPAPSVAIAGG